MSTKLYAYIEDGVVTNLLNAEPGVIDRDPRYVQISSENSNVKIGLSYSNGVFSEPSLKDDIYWTRIREERNKLLTESDWVVIKANESETSVPDEWKTYRQALRDITTTFENVNDVVFPDKPQ
jgi:hypothetical protein